jgi:hypothetical protein
MSSRRRTSRRAVVFGIGVSLAAHAAVFAFLSMEVPVLEKRAPVTWVFGEAPSLEPAQDPVMQVVELRLEDAAALSLETTVSAGGGAEEAGASPSSAPAPADARAIAPTVSSSDLSYDQLMVVEPVRSQVVTPVAFDQLAAAETAAPATPEKDDAPVYVPGSIGRAKRGWAAAGEGDGSGARGVRSGWTLVSGTGDGHCPMDPPGRGLPPTILR